jgi:Cu+-exporting ATPase
VSLSKSQPDDALLVNIPTSLPGDSSQLPPPDDAALTAAGVHSLPLMMLQRGDIVRVYAGAVFPADGTIISGSTSANEAMITGESRAISKPCGSDVIGGTSNLDSLVHVLVKKVAAESTLSSIVRLVQEAQASKPSTQRAADAVSARFIPVIIIITVASFFVWLSLVLSGTCSLHVQLTYLHVINSNCNRQVECPAPFILYYTLYSLVSACLLCRARALSASLYPRPLWSHAL